ncbi:MAG: hypothetical protein QG596_994 [Actinomycetota bacterium]|nr:hypothetical protein [Actinomycetota bacterium]
MGFGDQDVTMEWIDVAPLPDGSTYVLAGVPFRLYKLGADGELDRSFGNDGSFRPSTLFGNRTAGWGQVLAAPDGGPILIGSLARRATAVTRLEPDGRRDKSLGSGRPIFVRSAPNAIGAVDQAGRIVLVSNRKQSVIRLKTSGKIDPSFGENGISTPAVTWHTPYDVLATGGDIYVASYNRTLRLTNSGDLDLSLNGTGYVRAGGNQITALEDGFILSSSGGRVHRFTDAGSPYPGYGSSGNGMAFTSAATNSVGTALPDGSVIFVKDRTDNSFDQFYDLTRLEPNGQPDAGFGGDGSLEAGWLDGGPLPYSWTTADGRAAYWGGKPGHLDIRLVDSSGGLDNEFGTNGTASLRTPLVPDSLMSDSARRHDGSILAVGTIARSSGWDQGIAVASISRSGRPEIGFGNRGRLVLSDLAFRHPEPRLTLLPNGGAMICAKQRRDSVVWRISRAGRLVERFGDGGRLVLPFQGRCQDISFDGVGAVLSAMGIGADENELDLVRITPDGKIDASYGSGGIAERPPKMKTYVHQTRLFTDRAGRTVVVATVSDPPYIARFTREGRPDTEFGFRGIVYYGLHSVDQGYVPQKPIFLRGLGRISDVAFGPRGGIFLTGGLRKVAFVAKLGSRGFPVAKFGKGAIRMLYGSKMPIPKYMWPKNPQAEGIGVSPDGSILVTGFSRPTCNPKWGCFHPLLIKKLRPNGSIDREFERRAYRQLRAFPEAVGHDIYFDGRKPVVTGSIEFAPERNNFMVARFR